MKVVLSLWSKPAIVQGGLKKTACRWRDVNLHFCGWILSVFQAKKNYERVELVTDSTAAKVLIDVLDLPFDSVSTELDSIKDLNSNLWMTGKIKTYSLQKEPFMHIDSDVFLWKRFNEDFLKSDVIAQHLENEYNTDFSNVYAKYLEFMNSNSIDVGDYLKSAKMAYNCGIFGGNNINIINEYAEEALKVISNNNEKWRELNVKINGLAYCNAVIEQMLLYNFMTEKKIKVNTLFEPIFSEAEALDKGYTHLMHSKVDPTNSESRLIWEKIRSVVKVNYSDRYEKLEKWIKDEI